MAEELQPVAPSEDEEFEFRARAEQEARQRQAEGGGTPTISSEQLAEDAANKPLTPGQAAIGTLATGAHLAAEHPKVAGVLGDIGLAMLPKAAESVPVLGKAVSAAKYPFRLGQAALDALQRVGGQMPIQPSAPSAPIAQGAGIAAEQPGMLSRVGQLAGRYAPVLKMGGLGAQALFHSGGLNTNEDEELRKRRALTQMQGNPNNQQGMNALNSGFANQLNSLSR